jgi:hypothetical protein
LNQRCPKVEVAKENVGRERERNQSKNLFTTFIYEKGFLDLLFDAQDEGCVMIWMCHRDCNELKKT